MVVMATPVA